MTCSQGYVEALTVVAAFLTHAERESPNMMFGAITAEEAVEALAFITNIPVDKLRLLCKTEPRKKVI